MEDSSKSSSSDKKRRRSEKDCPGEAKRRKDNEDGGRTTHASPPSPVAGPSRDVNTAPPAPATPQENQLGRLTALLSDMMEKLDKSAAATTSGASEQHAATSGASCSGFSVAHTLSSSEEEGEIVCAPDPLDALEQLCSVPSAPQEDTEEDNAEYLKALDELSGHFHGEEEKGEPLFDGLASVLDTSLRRRPSSEGVKLTCGKIKLPSNVPNLSVPVTNSAIIKAMSAGGRLLDTKLFHTNSLLTKALVPIARCLSDIGERKGQLISHYLDGLNSSVRLLASAVNYINQLRKEVVRLNVHDTALAELCRWDCEVGKDSLFPFDVVKKCDELHRTKQLGRPGFRSHRNAGSRRYTANNQATRKTSYQRQYHKTSKPFLGRGSSHKKGTHQQRPYQ